MPIQDFTTQQVAEALKKLETDAKTLAKKKAGLNAKLSKLSAQRREVDETEKVIQRDIERLGTAKLLLQEIPEAVREIRRKLAEARVNVLRDDITVRQAGEFRVEVGELEKGLIAACPHSFIIQHDGYKDTYSHDRDGSYPGERACVLCDLHEYEYGQWGAEGGYKRLIEADHRLFARCPKDDLSGQRAAFKQVKDLRAIVAAFTDTRVLDLLAKMTRPPTG